VILRMGLALALATIVLGCSSEEGGGSPGGGSGSGGMTSSAGAGGSSAGSTAGGSTGMAGGGSSAGGASAGSGGTGGDAAGSSGSAGAAGSAGTAGSGGGPTSTLSFFVTSDTSMTGDLGGLAGADMRCQTLAMAAGAGDRTWRAYLSVESDPENGGNATHAKDRIGTGPWYNANGDLLANDLTELHAMSGDHTLFVDEYGMMINGQWEGSPDPNEHDILTGSNPDGTVFPGATCGDWTSSSPDDDKQVGHSDGLGPNMNSDPPYNSWNSAHTSGGCDDTAPAGGAGRIYCFAAD